MVIDKDRLKLTKYAHIEQNRQKWAKIDNNR